VREQISRAPGEAEAFEARFVAHDIHADFDNRLPVTYLKSRSVFLFAGIGHFGVLMEQVKRLAGKLAGTMELEDHQSFDAALLERIRSAAERTKADLILTTAKDWVKLGDFDFGRETYYLGLTVRIDKDRELLEIIERKLTQRRQAGAHG
jgi:tetraacyldisaccharide 4'-kinase